MPCSAVPRTCHTTRTIEVAPGRSVRVGAQLNSPSPFVHTVCKQRVVGSNPIVSTRRDQASGVVMGAGCGVVRLRGAISVR
jgi:hypothetical protein